MRKFVGENIEKADGLSLKEIAVLIRKEIRQYIKDNKLPIKASVKTEHHTAIQVKLTKVPAEYLNTEYDPKATEFGFNRNSQFTEEANRILKDIERIHQQYNYDNSDAMTDYFDVRYYGHASFCWLSVDEARNNAGL